MTEKTGKLIHHWPFLDFLRAMAALLVLFAHCRDFLLPNTAVGDNKGVFLALFYFITKLGHEAVVIFFVLSGFLIGGSLADSMQRGSFDLARYLMARFGIFIVYLPALVITQGVFLFGTLLLSNPGDSPLFANRQLDFGGVSQAICFLSGLQFFSCPVWKQNPPLWSLGYEWALYLFAPTIIQLTVWKASPALRLLAVSLVCAIALTVCQHPKVTALLFGIWFLGAGTYRVLNTRPVPLPVGLAGVGLMVAGMALHHFEQMAVAKTDIIIAAGAAIAMACRPLIAFPIAPRLFGWLAGFSYTLYAIHIPLVWLAVTLFRNMGSAPNIPPSPTLFMEFAATSAICLLIAFLVSLVTERKTGQVRAAMLQMCPPRPDRGASERGQ
jgi:peptidoglycan/LPS O-acetylase OafA/YrhL